MISNLKHAKESLERSVEVIKAQKKLYELLMEFEMNRRSAYWNSVMGRHSFHSSNINPLQEEMNKNKNKLEKAVSQLDILDHTVKEHLYTLQKSYGHRFKLHHEHQNYSCLNHGYIDHYGTIHQEYQPYPSEESRCYGSILPRRRIPKYAKVQESFQRRKHRYQQALLDLETERELDRMKHNEPNLPMDRPPHLFHKTPSYSNKRVQRKLHTMETKLQEQFGHVLKAEKVRQHLSRKLQLLNQHDGCNQAKRNLEKKLSDNITENVWKEKELVRNKQKISKLRHRQGYSRVERAFMALGEDPLFANISASVIQPTSSGEGATTAKPSGSRDDEEFSINSELMDDYKREQLLQSKLKEDLACAELNASQLLEALELERAKSEQERNQCNAQTNALIAESNRLPSTAEESHLPKRNFATIWKSASSVKRK